MGVASFVGSRVVSAGGNGSRTAASLQFSAFVSWCPSAGASAAPSFDTPTISKVAVCSPASTSAGCVPSEWAVDGSVTLWLPSGSAEDIGFVDSCVKYPNEHMYVSRRRGTGSVQPSFAARVSSKVQKDESIGQHGEIEKAVPVAAASPTLSPLSASSYAAPPEAKASATLRRLAALAFAHRAAGLESPTRAVEVREVRGCGRPVGPPRLRSAAPRRLSRLRPRHPVRSRRPPCRLRRRLCPARATPVTARCSRSTPGWRPPRSTVARLPHRPPLRASRDRAALRSRRGPHRPARLLSPAWTPPRSPGTASAPARPRRRRSTAPRRGITRQTRHRSGEMVRRYIRTATVFSDNAVDQVGCECGLSAFCGARLVRSHRPSAGHRIRMAAR